MNAGALNQLVLDIHAAPLDAERWPRLMDSLRVAHDADRALLFVPPPRPGDPFWGIGAEIDPEVGREYEAEFARDDVWLIGAKQKCRLATGTISVGDELIDRRDYLRSRFLNEYLKRFDIEHLMNVVLHHPSVAGAGPPVLSLYRSYGRGAFGDAEKALLEHLKPHLVLAIETVWRTRALEIGNAVLRGTLDAVTTPIFLIDRDGRLLFANGAGERALARGDLLRKAGAGLAPSPLLADSRSCALLLANLKKGLAGAVTLKPGADGRTITLSCAPLARDSSAAGPRGNAAGLIWLTPAGETRSAAQRIAMLFGLTCAEQRLLAEITAGSRLAESAAKLSISVHTARSQLKAIQQKTGWHRQSEIVRMTQQFATIDPGALAP